MKDAVYQELLDKRALDEVIYGQAMAVDMRDWDAYRAHFHDDLELDLGGHMKAMGGEGDGTMRGADNVIGAARRVLTGFDSYQHFVTNPVHHIKGDTAQTCAYVLGYHLLSNDRGDRVLLIGGIYTMGMLRTVKGWKIRKWHLHVLWYSGNTALYELAAAKAQSR